MILRVFPAFSDVFAARCVFRRCLFFFFPLPIKRRQISCTSPLTKNRKVRDFAESPGSSCCLRHTVPSHKYKSDTYFGPSSSQKKRRRKKEIKIQLTSHISSDFSLLFSLTFSLTLSSKVSLFQDALSLTFTLLGKWSKKKKKKKKIRAPSTVAGVPLQKSASAKCVYINVNACTQPVCSSEIDWCVRYVYVPFKPARTRGDIEKCSLFND